MFLDHCSNPVGFRHAAHVVHLDLIHDLMSVVAPFISGYTFLRYVNVQRHNHWDCLPLHCLSQYLYPELCSHCWDLSKPDALEHLRRHHSITFVSPLQFHKPKLGAYVSMPVAIHIVRPKRQDSNGHLDRDCLSTFCSENWHTPGRKDTFSKVIGIFSAELKNSKAVKICVAKFNDDFATYNLILVNLSLQANVKTALSWVKSRCRNAQLDSFNTLWAIHNAI